MLVATWLASQGSPACTATPGGSFDKTFPSSVTTRTATSLGKGLFAVEVSSLTCARAHVPPSVMARRAIARKSLLQRHFIRSITQTKGSTGALPPPDALAL